MSEEYLAHLLLNCVKLPRRRANGPQLKGNWKTGFALGLLLGLNCGENKESIVRLCTNQIKSGEIKLNDTHFRELLDCSKGYSIALLMSPFEGLLSPALFQLALQRSIKEIDENDELDAFRVMDILAYALHSPQKIQDKTVFYPFIKTQLRSRFRRARSMAYLCVPFLQPFDSDDVDQILKGLRLKDPSFAHVNAYNVLTFILERSNFPAWMPAYFAQRRVRTAIQNMHRSRVRSAPLLAKLDAFLAVQKP